MRENMDQNNYEYGHNLRREYDKPKFIFRAYLEADLQRCS